MQYLLCLLRGLSIKKLSFACFTYLKINVIKEGVNSSTPSFMTFIDEPESSRCYQYQNFLLVFDITVDR